MPVTSQTYIDIPFAASGSVTAVPDPVQGDGSVSFSQGYSANYTLAQGSPGSLNVEEVKMNYLFNLITKVLQTHQQQTIAPWIPTAANNGTPYPYSQYSLAMYTNGIAYISLVNANTVLPGSDSTKWQPITLGTGLLAANNLSDLGTLATALTNLGFASDSATYFKVPNPNNTAKPWIIQVFSVTTPNWGASSGTYAVSFPNSFPNSVKSITITSTEQANSGTGYGLVCSALSATTSGFTLRGDTNQPDQSINQAIPVFVTAIGN